MSNQRAVGAQIAGYGRAVSKVWQEAAATASEYAESLADISDEASPRPGGGVVNDLVNALIASDPESRKVLEETRRHIAAIHDTLKGAAMNGQLWGWASNPKLTPDVNLALGITEFTDRYGVAPTRCLVRPELAAQFENPPVDFVPHEQVPSGAFYFITPEEP